ncbi:MAG: Lrp/AsnC family transcriptional regulator [Chthonomonas sp.]|nr:Lrp/AsnC family transcriptional regulator [Chthonomonas sp.]
MAYRDSLDEIDLKILDLLQRDGRITNADLARLVGLSPPSVLQRVRKLEDAGVIVAYETRLDAEKLGFGLLIYVQIGLSLHHDRAITEFRRAVKAMPEVLECQHVSGDFDFLLKVVAQDMRTYEKFVTEKISIIRGVGKIHSFFTLGTTKDTNILPLEQVK